MRDNDTTIIPEITNRAGLSMFAEDLAITVTVDGQEKDRAKARRIIPMYEAMQDSGPVDWLIEPYLEAESLCGLFAPSGSGKSFIALDLAAHVAMGRSWHGYDVQQGAAVYICGESTRGLVRRSCAWFTRYQEECRSLHLVKNGMNALEPLDVTELSREMDAIHQGEPIRLIVLDTVARNFGAGDENSAKDMAMFVRHMDLFKARYQCAVLLVHHCGHDQKSRARGSSVFRASLDTEFTCQKFDRLIELSGTKQKDADLPEPVRFELIPVDTADGISSAVLQKTDKPLPEEDDDVSSQPTLSPKYQTALNILEGMAEEYREKKQRGGLDEGLILVEAKDWRKRCLDAQLTQPKNWSRIPELLEKKGLIRRQGIHVFLTVLTGVLTSEEFSEDSGSSS